MNKKISKEQSHKQLQFPLKPICAAVLLVFAVQTTQANPIGPSVMNGQASFATIGNALTVTNTPGAIIHWQGFSIGANEITRFAQQSASSAVLNRVISNNPSSILGSLQSNGRVFLVNPNGIVFGAGATIDVAGMVASTLNLSNADFLAGRYHFTQVPGAQNISNAGNLTAQSGGQIYLIAPNVENTGVITAPNGEILLAAGHSVDLVNTTNPNLRVSITAPAGDATNVGQLIASSGSLGLFGTVVRNSGTVSADSATMQGGKIVLKASQRIEAGGVISSNGTGGGEIKLLADMQNGTVDVNAVLAANAPSAGNGGFIETSAAHVQVADTARISTAAPFGKTGTWLIDPTDYVIAAAPPGGSVSYMSNTALASSLGSSNVIIQTLTSGTGNGDIFVNDAVSWASANSLTLNAIRNVNINAVIGNTGTGNLIVRSDLNGISVGTITFGASGSVALSGGGRADLYYNPTAYNSPNNYSANMGSTPFTAWMLVNDVSQLQAMNTNLGGTYALGRNIDACATGGCGIPANAWNGGAGFAPVGNLTTNFTGSFDGLGHTITNLTINRSATDYVGLFGYTNGAAAIITNVGLVGSSVTGNFYVGGLAGYNNGATITNSYSTGGVTGYNAVGGLVGRNYSGGTITNSYSAGSVSGSLNSIGGLVGFNAGSITNSYSTASVMGGGEVGGLVGYNYFGTITNSYSTGSVSGTLISTGGLVGVNQSGTVTNSYWDTVTSLQSTSAGGTGRITDDMMQTANFTGWDFTNTWWLSAGNTRPFLRSEYSTTISNAHQLQLMGMNATTLAASYTLGANINMAELSQTSGLWNTTTGFAPVGIFTGQFDGASRSITNLFINRPTESNVGLFGRVLVGSVSNVALVNASVTGHIAVGSLVGFNSGTISYSSASGNVFGISGTPPDDAYWVGGLVGQNSGTISYSSASANVDGLRQVGGLVGDNGSTGTINYSSATGNVTGSYHIGGLVGTNPGIINFSTASGNVLGTYWQSNVGGLVGYNNGGTISNSDWTPTSGNTVSGNSNVGGLVGYNEGSIDNSSAGGSGGADVTGYSNIGGLVGYNGYNSSVSLSSASGNVVGTGYGNNNIGGLVGFNGGSISDSSAIGSVTGNDHVGGLLGANAEVYYSGGYYYGSVSNSFATGTVTGVSNVGGLVGGNDYPSNSITANSYATGSVTGNYSVGGLAGSSDGTISDVHASGFVTGIVGTGTSGTLSHALGGLVGTNWGAISNSYVSSGSVTSASNLASNLGGLVGYNSGTLTNSHYNINGVTINGRNYVTLGGLYNDVYNNHDVYQYDDWFNGGLLTPLDIANYSYKLIPTGVNSYSISTADGMKDLLGFADNPALHFSLGSNIDLSTTTLPTSGLYIPELAGSFDGAGFTISNLNLNQSFTSNLGLFGHVASSSTVNNVTLVDASVIGGNNVGALAGLNEGTISNSSVSVSVNTSVIVTGNYNVGGLVGNNNGSISNSHISNGNVTGGSSVGGLVGYNTGTISNSYVDTGTVVSGGNSVGGLVGNNQSLDGPNYGGHITSSYVDNGTVTGNNNVGGLVGINSGIVDFGSVINNSTIIATGTSSANAGGLVGRNNGTISNSFVSGGSVTASSGSDVGGLVGYNNRTISNSHADSTTVTGSSNVGGLVGYNNDGGTTIYGFWGGHISNSYVSGGTVIGSSNVGGLAGYNNGSIVGSFVDGGSVNGSNNVGGLVGYNGFGGTTTIYSFLGGRISNSYVNGGTVTGSSNVGGLVGYNNSGGTDIYGPWGAHINNSYASNGSVSGGIVGGLVGYNYFGVVSNNFWDVAGGAANGIGLDAVLATPSDIGAAGLTTAGMMTMANFTGAGWSIASTGGAGMVWRIYEGSTAPLLTSFLKQLTITADPASKTYDGLAYSGVLVNPVYNPLSPDLTHVLGSANAYGVNAINKGTYAPALYSDQQGYDISYVGGALTITAAALNAISLSGTRAYDGTVDVAASIFTLSGLVGSETLTLTGVATIANKNVGTYTYSATLGSLTLGSLTLGDGTNGGLASNYTFTGGTQTANIIAANLTVSGMTAANKVYDGTTTAVLSGGALLGLVGNETLTFSGQVGTFADKNAGIAKAVAVSGLTLGNSTGLASNYTITLPTGIVADITSRSIALSADPATKVYGNTDPALTFTVGGMGLATLDTNATAFTGALTRTAGEAVATSPYAISQGTLAASANYTVTGFTTNNLIITQALLTVTADALTKLEGGVDPLLTYMVSGLKFTDTAAATLNGALARLAGETAGAYPINQGTLALLSTNYTMSYVPASFSIVAAPVPPPAPLPPPDVVTTVVDSIVSNFTMTPASDTTNVPPPADSNSTTEDNKKKAEDVVVAEGAVAAQADATPVQQLPVCK